MKEKTRRKGQTNYANRQLNAMCLCVALASFFRHRTLIEINYNIKQIIDRLYAIINMYTHMETNTEYRYSVNKQLLPKSLHWLNHFWRFSLLIKTL